MTPDIIDGKYKVLEHVDSGGMAHIYRCMNLGNRRIVAIKILKDEFRDDKEFLRRFEREARASLHLSHDNIVHAYGLGTHEGLPYIVQEFIEGQTLKQLIINRGPLPIRTAIGICCQILDALSAAHASGIIHRDVKPQNVLITPKGKAKLTDFGIAREVSASTVTFSGNQVIGSVHYISPEQAQGQTVTEASDIYSVGVTMYEMVTSIVPFEGDSTVTVALMHIRNQPIPPIDLNGRIPPSLNDVILRALSKSPDDRYRSAHAMRIDLIRTLSNPNGDFAQQSSSDEPILHRRRARRRITLYTWISLSVTAPILLIVLLYLGFSSGWFSSAKSNGTQEQATALAATAPTELPTQEPTQEPLAPEYEMPDLMGLALDEALSAAYDAGIANIFVTFSVEATGLVVNNSVMAQSILPHDDVRNFDRLQLTVHRDKQGFYKADVSFIITIPQNDSNIEIVYQTANYDNIPYSIILYQTTRAAEENATVVATLYAQDSATRTLYLMINGETVKDQDVKFSE